MAASVTTASTTLEAQLLEIAGEVQVLEQTQSTDELPLNNCQIDFDLEEGTVSITAILPITYAVVAGNVSIEAGTYLA